jgi:hypothetical protein
MKSFEVVPVTETVVRAFEEGSRDDSVLLRVVPPKETESGSWFETGIELNRSFHRLQEESRLFGTRNSSSTYGMEIWYENEAVQFYYSVPNQVEEDHFRRQISGRFYGVDIDKVLNRDEKFISVEEGEYVGATRLSLRRHFFEPIRHPRSEGDDMENDPYQTLLPEIDTKDGSRIMIQVLFRPAREKWTRLHFMDVNYYAKRLEEDGYTDTKLFGLSGQKVQSESAATAVAMRIRQQEKKPAFHVDIRVVVVADSQERVQHQLSTIATLYEQLYRTEIGQSFVPVGTTSELLPDVIRRDSSNLEMPTGVWDYLTFNLRRVCNCVVLTIPELTGVSHLPIGNELNVDGVNWNDVLVKGTLPPNAPKHRPLSESEKAEWQAEHGISDPLTGDEELLDGGETESDSTESDTEADQPVVNQ